jgi:signal transduction histidine kinase/DNA-binding response OmpR family regulator/streptogramin lyase
VGTDDGLNIYHPSNGHFTIYRNTISNRLSLANNAIKAIVQISDGKFWIGQKGGLCKFDSSTQNFSCLPQQYLDLLCNDYANNIFEDSRHNIWIATEFNGILKLLKSNGQIINYNQQLIYHSGLSNLTVKQFTEDRDGNIWIATDCGLIKYIPTIDRFEQLLQRPNIENGLSSNVISAVYLDKENRIWVGTKFGGINVHDPNRFKFKHYKNQPFNTNSIVNNNVQQFAETKNGDLWIATDGGGLSYLDRKNNRFTHYQHQPGNPNSVSTNKVLTLCTDENDGLWIGTWEGGLDYFDKKKNKFTHYTYDRNNKNSISSNCIFNIYRDQNNNIWVGTWNKALNLYNRQSNNFTRYMHFQDEDAFHPQIIQTIADKIGNLWIATEVEGLRKFNINTGKITTYTENKSVPNSISSKGVLSMLIDSKNRFWVGTKNGLDLFDTVKKSFKNFAVNQGLPNNYIYGILEDSKHFLWLSTNNGICRFDPETHQSIVFTLKDGLQSVQFNRWSFFKLSSGEMAFGGINGFNLFDPNQFKENKNLPRLYITELQISNQTILPKKGSILEQDISFTKELHLSYNQNSLTIGFVALTFTQPEKCEYACMLEGFDKQWNNIGKQRVANYTNLNPGTYIFRVKASNNNGIWSENKASLKIIIKPPFWKTFPAYAFYLIMLFGALYLYRRHTIIAINLKNDLLIKQIEFEKIEQVNQIKLNFFTHISHELRTPLTLIIGPLENTIKNGVFNKAQLETMLRNSKRLFQLINQLLDFRKIETHSMEVSASEINLENFISEIIYAFEPYTNLHQQAVTFMPFSQPVIIWADADMLEKILFNLLSNAIKFTSDGGDIQIKIEKHGASENFMNGYAEIHVSDNGIGISEQNKEAIFNSFFQEMNPSEHHKIGSGIGLALVKELIELHHGKIWVESHKNQGSCFIIQLPIGKDHFKKDQLLHNHESNRINQHLLQKQIEENLELQNTNNSIDKPKKFLKNLPTILIVEDNIEMQAFVADLLDSQYNILLANNGKQGFELCTENIPDIVISDIIMPEMDGLTLCNSLKNDIRTSHIPIILLTAKSSDDDKLTGFKAGADAYLPKPFNAGDLEMRLQNILFHKAKLREYFNREVLVNSNVETPVSQDSEFIKQLIDCVHRNLADPEFNILKFAADLSIGRNVLFKKTKELSGLTPNDFIMLMRLNKAAVLLINNTGNISEIAYSVGFTDPFYFSRCFKKQYGQTPTEYKKVNGKENEICIEE